MVLMELLETIDKLDRQLLIFLNQLHHPIMDKIMLYATERFFWVPFYLALVVFMIWKLKKESVWVLVTITLLIVAADQFA